MKNRETSGIVTLAVGPLLLAAMLSAEGAEGGQTTNLFGIWHDGHREIAASCTHEKVGSPREVQRAPLFDNLPFLQLRQGDKFVKGHRWNRDHKVGDHFSKDEYYFVLSSGKYYQLSTSDEGKELHLVVRPYLCLLFDWDVTLANAQQLKDLYPPAFGRHLRPEAYPSLVGVLRRKFPDSIQQDKNPTLGPMRIEGERPNTHAAFEGLAYAEDISHTIFHYRVEIGHNVFRQTRKKLMIGPAYVGAWELKKNLNPGPNACPFPPSKETLRALRAGYKEGQRFHAIVKPFLAPLP